MQLFLKCNSSNTLFRKISSKMSHTAAWNIQKRDNNVEERIIDDTKCFAKTCFLYFRTCTSHPRDLFWMLPLTQKTEGSDRGNNGRVMNKLKSCNFFGQHWERKIRRKKVVASRKENPKQLIKSWRKNFFKYQVTIIQNGKVLEIYCMILCNNTVQHTYKFVKRIDLMWVF